MTDGCDARVRALPYSASMARTSRRARFAQVKNRTTKVDYYKVSGRCTKEVLEGGGSSLQGGKKRWAASRVSICGRKLPCCLHPSQTY